MLINIPLQVSRHYMKHEQFKNPTYHHDKKELQIAKLKKIAVKSRGNKLVKITTGILLNGFSLSNNNTFH